MPARPNAAWVGAELPTEAEWEFGLFDMAGNVWAGTSHLGFRCVRRPPSSHQLVVL